MSALVQDLAQQYPDIRQKFRAAFLASPFWEE